MSINLTNLEKLPVYKLYETTTGKNWKTARASGLTDGTMESNLKLRESLLARAANVNSIGKIAPITVTSITQDESYTANTPKVTKPVTIEATFKDTNKYFGSGTMEPGVIKNKKKYSILKKENKSNLKWSDYLTSGEIDPKYGPVMKLLKNNKKLQLTKDDVSFMYSDLNSNLSTMFNELSEKELTKGIHAAYTKLSNGEHITPKDYMFIMSGKNISKFDAMGIYTTSFDPNRAFSANKPKIYQDKIASLENMLINKSLGAGPAFIQFILDKEVADEKVDLNNSKSLLKLKKEFDSKKIPDSILSILQAYTSRL